MPDVTTASSGKLENWVIIAASAPPGFVLLVLVVVTCICYCRWKSKNSANVRVPRTERHTTKQNHYASPPIDLESTTRGHVKKVAVSRMVSDHQHPNDLEKVEGICPTVQLMPTTSTAGQTGSSTGVAVTDHKEVDALYSKVKKKKRTRVADLYSKPDKRGKGHTADDRLHGANTEGGNEADKEDLYTRSSKQKRGKGKSENESETADDLYTKSAKQKRGKGKRENESETTDDDLYTKSAKQKRGKGKSENESETADELYTKPAKKGKKSKQADYANYNLVKDLNGDDDVSASGDVTQRANCHNGIMDNELYKK